MRLNNLALALGMILLYNKMERADLPMLLLALSLCGAGLLLAASMEYIGAAQELTSGSTDGLLKRQAAAVAAGLIFREALILFGSRRAVKAAPFIFAGGALLTALTFSPLGVSPAGSDDRAWLELGGTTIQPSEILKLCFIISFAAHLDRCGEKLNSPGALGLLLLHSAFPAALCWAQGDQGTALIFIIVAGWMLVSAGISMKWRLAAAVMIPAAGWAAWRFLLAEHHKQRLALIAQPSLDPLGAGFQQLCSRRAIAGGGWLGSGLFSRQRDLVYVSQAQNDMIFSYAAQTGGFLLCAVIIILLFAAVLRAVTVSHRSLGAGALMSSGTAALIFSHAFLNIAMTLGLAPVIGVPLPFVSSGGTAAACMLGATAFVRAENRKESYEDNDHTRPEPQGLDL